MSGEPLVLEASEAIRWTHTAEVVVVGFGMAGACAVIEAR